MTDLDDLRKRVEQSKDCMIAPRWADLIHDLWRAVEEKNDKLNDLWSAFKTQADLYEPVTAEDLAGVIYPIETSLRDAMQIIRRLGPLYRQRKI
jgi:hypothetical protein